MYQVYSTGDTVLEHLSVAHVETDTTATDAETARKHCSEPLDTPEAPDERYKALTKQLRTCGALLSADLWAVSPLPQVLGELAIYYSEKGIHLTALAIASRVATACDPHRYPAPFHPVRVKNILAIAKLLANTAASHALEGDALEGDTLSRKVDDALRNIDQVSLCQMLLLLVLKLGPQGYMDDWELGISARELLDDIDKLPGREQELSLISAWNEDPRSEQAMAFFQYAVVRQLDILTEASKELVLKPPK